MSHIVDSFRRHQKMIILGAALGVIALYIIPLDQINNALGQTKLKGIDNAISHIQDTQARILAKNLPNGNSYKIAEHLGNVISHLQDVRDRLAGLGL